MCEIESGKKANLYFSSSLAVHQPRFSMATENAVDFDVFKKIVKLSQFLYSWLNLASFLQLSQKKILESKTKIIALLRYL